MPGFTDQTSIDLPAIAALHFADNLHMVEGRGGCADISDKCFFFFFCPRRAAEAEVCEHNLGTINETKIVFNFWILAFSWQEKKKNLQHSHNL